MRLYLPANRGFFEGPTVIYMLLSVNLNKFVFKGPAVSKREYFTEQGVVKKSTLAELIVNLGIVSLIWEFPISYLSDLELGATIDGQLSVIINLKPKAVYKDVFYVISIFISIGLLLVSRGALT